MTDQTEASMQARLMRLAHDEREISASLRGSAMPPPQMFGQQVPSQFLTQVAGQRSPAAAVSMDTAISPPIGTPGQQQQWTVSLAEATKAPPTKAASGSEGCEPACKKDQGICVNDFCLCHSPWSGESCEVAEAFEDGIPFEKDAQKMFSPEIGEAMKEKVAMPLAIFIWTSLLVLTFFCTAFCPQFCCRRSSGGPDAVAEYDVDFDKAETQFDIVEAWTFDSRKRHDREGQNEAQRREWFEDNVGPKLQQIKWPHVHR